MRSLGGKITDGKMRLNDCWAYLASYFYGNWHREDFAANISFRSASGHVHAS